MRRPNYQKICSDFFVDLPERTKDVLGRRFGLNPPAGGGERETLESVGKSYGVTRERIRQIEADGLLKLKPKLKKNQKVFQYFIDSLKSFGNLKKEDLLLSQLGGEKFGPQVFFLLSLSEKFKRFPESEDFHSLWTIDSNSLNLAKEIIDDFSKKLNQIKKPLSLEDYTPPVSLKPKTLISYLEVSRLIGQGLDGEFGLRNWPEINPRGIKDKAYLVFKKENKPLHFSKVANLIGPDALVQTVHNELIRDSRFVLVGRGTYALSEWGYRPGTVKDIIVETLKKAERPLSKEEILEKVLKQRLVKENTIFLNLSNRGYFSRNPQGKYRLNLLEEKERPLQTEEA